MNLSKNNNNILSKLFMENNVINEGRFEEVAIRFPEFKDEIFWFKTNNLKPKYIQWLISQFKNLGFSKEEINLEDNLKLLNNFDKLSERNQIINKDINKYKSLEDVISVVEIGLKKQETKQQDTGAGKDYIKIYDDQAWLVIQPRTKEASCRLGKNTKWCISATQSENFFDSYTSADIDFAFVFDKSNNKKYAISFDKQNKNVEIYDEEDDIIDQDILSNLLPSFVIDKINSFFKTNVLKKINIEEISNEIDELIKNPISFSDNAFLKDQYDDESFEKLLKYGTLEQKIILAKFASKNKSNGYRHLKDDFQRTLTYINSSEYNKDKKFYDTLFFILKSTLKQSEIENILKNLLYKTFERYIIDSVSLLQKNNILNHEVKFILNDILVSENVPRAALNYIDKNAFGEIKLDPYFRNLLSYIFSYYNNKNNAELLQKLKNNDYNLERLLEPQGQFLFNESKNNLKNYIKTIVESVINERKKVPATKPEIFYHGTSSKNLQSILQNGMQANPQTKVWNTEKSLSNTSASQRSLESLEGSYWTRNLMTAYSSAGGAKNKDHDRLIVIASISPKETLPDEDNVYYAIERAAYGALNDLYGAGLMRSGNEHLAIKLLPMILKNEDEVLNTLAKSFDEKIKKQKSLNIGEKKPENIQLAKQVMQALLDRIYAHVFKNDSMKYMFVDSYLAEFNMSRNEKTREDAEEEYSFLKDVKYNNISKYEKQFSNALNNFTKFYKETTINIEPEGEVGYSNNRYIKDLGYTNRSKILAIVSIKSDLYNNIIKIEFKNNQFPKETQEAISKFLEDFGTRVGLGYKIIN